jgi:hypothetical protein
MVCPFGVGDVVWQRKVNKTTSTFVWQMKDKFLFIRFSAGLWYKFYRASHFAHTQGVKQDQK